MVLLKLNRPRCQPRFRLRSTLKKIAPLQNCALPKRYRNARSYRAHILRLNAQGWTVPAIAAIFNCHEHTVRATIRRWLELGLGGLWEAPGRGKKRKWLEADMQYLEQCLEQEQRTYNSAQLAAKLEQEREVRLSADRIRRILKKRGSDGNAPAGVSTLNKTRCKSN